MENGDDDDGCLLVEDEFLVLQAKKSFSVLKFKYLSKNTFCVYFNTIPRVSGGRESLKVNHRQKFLFIILTLVSFTRGKNFFFLLGVLKFTLGGE
jgi:hypothetical protein